ncbi:MAG: hypothetical protein MUO40_03800 [Anaerolineaceae bacterium]|nr:hypothetical protein [Anaerolineaceae bacterium]
MAIKGTNEEAKDSPQGSRSLLALLFTSVQVGCLTVVILGLFVVGGILLDRAFGTQPWIMIGLVCLSFPITMVLNYLVVKRQTKKLSPQPKANENSGIVESYLDDDEND